MLLHVRIGFIPFLYHRVSKCAFSSSYGESADVNGLLENVYVLCRLNRLQEALSLFKTLQGPFLSRLHGSRTYAALFHACAVRGCITQGQSLHLLMVTRDPVCSSDLYVLNHLIIMYAKCGWLGRARQLFDEMPNRNAVSWTALISGYSQNGYRNDCFLTFREMLFHFRPTEFAFSSVISSCSEHDADPGRQVHALALKQSFDVYLFVANALISMYSNICMNDAWAVFKSMEFQNVISWNSLIAGLQLWKLGFQAVCLFSEMHSSGIGFDRATLLSILPSLSPSSGVACDLGLKVCLQLHCLSLKTGRNLEIQVATALIKAYSELGEVFTCFQIFMEAHEQSDLVAWTAIMKASVDKAPENTLYLFSLLRRNGFGPDAHTFSIALKASASIAAERSVWVIHSQIVRDGFGDDIVLKNALIYAYARCGSVSLSRKVFDEIPCPDTITWNSMLKAYSLQGQAKQAIELFSRMNVNPDGTTFVSLLSACSHRGMVEEGLGIFNAMWKNYAVVPELDHYACLVDILGRSGHVFEAKELVSKMPLRPDSVVWSALLAACGKHSETQLAISAAANMKNMDPGNSLGYVQISSLYSSSGVFNRAQLIRNDMEESGVKKEPGRSWY